MGYPQVRDFGVMNGLSMINAEVQLWQGQKPLGPGMRKTDNAPAKRRYRPRTIPASKRLSTTGENHYIDAVGGVS